MRDGGFKIKCQHWNKSTQPSGKNLITKKETDNWLVFGFIEHGMR